MAKRKAKDEAPLREWDMLPDEEPQVYERFTWYLNYPYLRETDKKTGETILTMEIDKTKRRSYRAVAQHFGVSTGTIEKQGKRYDWQRRCEAYDAYMALAKQQKHERDIIKMQGNHATLGAAMVKRAAARFLSLPEEDISAADAIRMADVGVKIERQARGVSADDNVVVLSSTPPPKQPTAQTDVTPLFDVSTLSDEELVQLEGIIGKLAASPDE
ncbi:MAG: hypothetical protein LUE24_01805 [Lachnospiraceae bacterium]|nr:hypothetical protein [Lachnospiraceae bacterium]